MLMTQLDKSKMLNEFWNGKTNIDDENKLKDIVGEESEASIESIYFDYIESKQKVPESLVSDIQAQVGINYSFVKWKRYAAAAVLVGILSGVGLQLNKQSKTKHHEQYLALDQAMNAIKGVDDNAAGEIVYEDDLLVIVYD